MDRKQSCKIPLSTEEKGVEVGEHSRGFSGSGACISRHLSGQAYELLCESGYIKLLCESGYIKLLCVWVHQAVV